MARTKTRTCSVTGMKTSTNNFYANQTHVKAVDNLRRVTGANNCLLYTSDAADE